MYATRTPITDDNLAAFQSAQSALPKPLISNAAGHPRQMSVGIMGEWVRARPGVTDVEIAKEFTAAERGRFLEGAIDYAIRRSGAH